MNLTELLNDVFPEDVRSRYFLRETCSAITIPRATSPELFDEPMTVLNKLRITSDDLLRVGGQESGLARRFNKELRNRGWREAQVDTEIKFEFCIIPYKSTGETRKAATSIPVSNKGYKIGNFKGCAALDLEWNAKGGNLDRDINTYRVLYDAGFIDVGVTVTRTQEDFHNFAARLRLQHGMSEDEAKKMLATTTTTNLEKPIPRMARGGDGDHLLLAVAISNNTSENSPTRQSESLSQDALALTAPRQPWPEASTPE